MSTNRRDAPEYFRDADSISSNNQLDPLQNDSVLEHKPNKLQSKRHNDLGLHQGDISQTFTNTDVDDTLKIPGWPEPQTLPKKGFISSLGYMLFLLTPLFFLVLVVSTIVLQSQGTNQFGRFVSQACLVGPTVFPIAFSAILGWCLKTYGRYKSERGVRLGELERMIGSQTLFSFLKSAFTFKELDRLCIIFGILWILSPLGGQGFLRMLSVRREDISSKEVVGYLDLYSDTVFGIGRAAPSGNSVVNALYVSSIYAPIDVKNNTTDLWGGIKIPSIESLDFDHQGDDGVAVGDVSTYTSLLGIPMNSTISKSASSYTFNFRTAALTAQCEEPQLLGRQEVVAPTNSNTFELETPYSVGNITERKISLISYRGGAGGLESALVYNCTIVPNFLLAEANCNSGHCSVSRMKKIDDPKSTNDRMFGPSSQTERYLYDPQTIYPDDGPWNVDLREIPTAEFSRRFATILNTYYQATISPTVRLSIFRPSDPSDDAIKSTEATILTRSSEIYQRHWEWVILALVASFAMLVVAITGILLERRVISPDIYGYVSSMTRDNPYFPLAPTGCTLDGSQRAVLLKDVVVRFEDVAPDKEVGHLAFTMAGYKTPTEQSIDRRLQREKMYSGCSCMQQVSRSFQGGS